MNTTRSIRSFSAATEAALWKQIAADMAREENPLEYAALLNQDGYQFMLDIDIDLGTFGGGTASTTLAALVPGYPTLRFSLVEQDLVHKLGKLLGLEDIVLDYPELDAAFVISTNDAPALRELLADADLRATLLKYRELNLTLGPTDDESEDVYLVFSKEAGIVEPGQLREIYHLLYALLQRLELVSNRSV